MARLKVFSIIINYKRPEETRNCLQSLDNQKGDFDNQLVVVDNAPEANFQKRTNKTTIIKNNKNLGFAAGNNVGIKYALKNQADLILLVNDDAYLDKDCLLALSQFLYNNDKAAIASPKIYFAPGYEFHKERYKKNDLGKVIWYAGGKIDWNNIYASHIGVDGIDKGQYSQSQETEFASGCVMMIKREVFKKIGLLDEKYFMYWEDVDFCLRAKKAGDRTYFFGQAKAWHKNLGTRPGVKDKDKEKQMARSRLRFGLKHACIKTKLLLIKQYVLLDKRRSLVI